MDATTQPEPSQNVGVQPLAESPAQSHEAYAKAKQVLIDALARKRGIDRQLISCEVQIYNFEASYLTETVANGGGNIIQGFDSYLKNPGGNKRRTEVNDADRMFSNSSSTYAKSLEMQAEESDTPSEPLGKINIPALQTVMLPPATRQQELQSAVLQKKERDRLYQRQKRARRESRTTVSGDENDYSGGSTTRRKRSKFMDEE